jgi:hypothetical protein
VSRAIDDVNPIPFLQKMRGPAAPAVGRAHPIEALSAAAVHQHDRVGMFYLRGDPGFNVHLAAVDDGAAGEIGAVDANPEIAPFGEIERDFRGCGGASFGGLNGL